jgi:hypothetical protein
MCKAPVVYVLQGCAMQGGGAHSVYRKIEERDGGFADDEMRLCIGPNKVAG